MGPGLCQDCRKGGFSCRVRNASAGILMDRQQRVQHGASFLELSPDLFKRRAVVGRLLAAPRPTCRFWRADRPVLGPGRRFVRVRCRIRREKARHRRRDGRRAIGPRRAQQFLYAANRIAILVKTFPDAAQQENVFRPIVATAAAALQRLQLWKLRFPEAQDVRRKIEVVRDLADRAKRRGAFLGPGRRALACSVHLKPRPTCRRAT